MLYLSIRILEDIIPGPTTCQGTKGHFTVSTLLKSELDN